MPESDALYVKYHDEEWGVPVRDDARLFEMLTLEGAQAGLSWITILKKRDGYRQAFMGFDPAQVARLGARDVKRLMGDASIVRNRLKIESTINNASAILQVQKEHDSLADFLWTIIGGAQIANRHKNHSQIQPQTELSRRMSRELKAAGFRFVGPTICYAFMQAVGMVNDHETGCFRHAQIVDKH